MKISDVSDQSKIQIFGSGNPKTLIMAGQHGNEAHPVYFAEKFGLMIKKIPVQGTIILIPCVNPGALRDYTREYRGVDMNRGYGTEPHAMSEITSKIENLIQKVDYVIDIHSTPSNALTFPCVLVDEGDENQEKLAELFKMPTLQYQSDEHTLRRFCSENGKPCLTVELVEDPEYTKKNNQICFQGIMNFLKSTKII